APGPRRPAAPARRHRALPFVLVFLLVAGVMVTALVTTQALVAQGAFRIQELTERVDRLRSGYGRLQLRHAELTSPGRIEAWAERAGLVPRHGLEVLTVAPSRSGGSGAGGLVVARGPDG
ncbi:MAG TPA: hypothetical protein VHL78_13920, partial [Actinomycetota bacterium]|nr:hypothetical protein [Actinomycetota bacterium]